MAEKIFPYELPENWQWTTLGKICEFERGITFPASAKEKGSTEKNIPCIRTANVQEKLEITDLIYVDKSYTRNNSSKFLKVDDIIMSSANSKELVGKTCYVYSVPSEMTFGGFVIVIRAKEIFSRYLFYFLRCEFLFGKFIDKSTQTINIANINTQKLSNYLVPLPPIDEQKKIVERIESLFSKLDKAKALAQNIIDNYELRRSAILHKAFTGQLTNPDLNDWKIFSWESCIKKMQNGISKRNGDTGDEIIVLRLYDIKNNEINLSNARTISLNDKEQENYLLKINNLLMIRVNGSKDNVGKQLLIKSSDKLAFCDHLIRIQYIDEIFPKYMLYFSQCKDYKDYVLANIVSSAGQNTISRKGMTNLNIPIPNIDEQKEIVRILDSLLAKEQQTKELAEQVLQKIDLMKKAILARAFRGELKTNEVIF